MDTETTAYACLATLNMIKIDAGLTIVRQLATQKNPWGSFGSTQVWLRLFQGLHVGWVITDMWY